MEIDRDSLCALAFLTGCPLALLIWLNLNWADLGELTRIYFAGIIAYWIRFGFFVLANLVRLFSTFDINMAKIGMVRNIYLGTMQERQSIDHVYSIMSGLFGFLLMSLLSWFAFLLDVFLIVRRSIHRCLRPAEMKKIEWTLKSFLLSPLDVMRFDVKGAEILLGRRLTDEECDSRQQHLDANGIDLKMSDVIALNTAKTPLERSTAEG